MCVSLLRYIDKVCVLQCMSLCVKCVTWSHKGDRFSRLNNEGFVGTVTFGRKCHSVLNDVSNDSPDFGAYFQYRLCVLLNAQEK